jgi:hypothetical protein
MASNFDLMKWTSFNEEVHFYFVPPSQYAAKLPSKVLQELQQDSGICCNKFTVFLFMHN